MLATAFEQLGLEPGASRPEVERAWRHFALRYHPDRGGDAAAFVRGQQAYDTIIEEFESWQYGGFWQAYSTGDGETETFEVNWGEGQIRYQAE